MSTTTADTQAAEACVDEILSFGPKMSPEVQDHLRTGLIKIVAKHFAQLSAEVSKWKAEADESMKHANDWHAVAMRNVELRQSIANLRAFQVEVEGVTISAADALLLIGDRFGDRPFTIKEFNEAMLVECRRRKRATPCWWKPWTWKKT